MKKFFSKLVTAATILGLQIPSAAIAAPACPKGKEVRIDIQTVQQFLDYMDLEAGYMSSMENGGPGFFVAVPQLVIVDATTFAPKSAPQDMFGYYFKGSTGLAMQVYGPDGEEGEFFEDGEGEEPGIGEGGYSGKPLDSEYWTSYFMPYNAGAKASIGQTGFPGYPCVRDDNMNIAKIDAAAFNKVATEDELKKLGIVYHPKYPPELKAAPGLPLTLADKQIALGKPTIDDKYVPTAAEQKVLAGAAVAKLHLKRLMTGMRISPGRDSGIVIDCQPTQTDADPSGYKGGTLLPILITPDTWADSGVKVQMIWHTGTVKDVGGKKVVVDSSGNPMKADGINFYGDNFGGDFIWWKRPDAKTQNVEAMINAYRAMGYKYEAAKTSDVSCEPKVKLNKVCGLTSQNKDKNIEIASDYSTFTVINKKNVGKYGTSFSDISDTDFTALSSAACSCSEVISNYYSNYDDEKNIIDLSYLALVRNVTTSDLKTCASNKDIFKMYCGRVTKDEKGRLFIHDTPYNDIRFIPEKSKVGDAFTVGIDSAATKKIFSLKAGDCGCVTGIQKYYSKEDPATGEYDYFSYFAYGSDSLVKKDSVCKKEGL